MRLIATSRGVGEWRWIRFSAFNLRLEISSRRRAAASGSSLAGGPRLNSAGYLVRDDQLLAMILVPTEVAQPQD